LRPSPLISPRHLTAPRRPARGSYAIVQAALDLHLPVEIRMLFHVFVENIREGAAGISQDGKVIYANQIFHLMLGLRPDEMIGTKFADHVLIYLL